MKKCHNDNKPKNKKDRKNTTKLCPQNYFYTKSNEIENKKAWKSLCCQRQAWYICNLEICMHLKCNYKVLEDSALDNRVHHSFFFQINSIVIQI